MSFTARDLTAGAAQTTVMKVPRRRPVLDRAKVPTERRSARPGPAIAPPLRTLAAVMLAACATTAPPETPSASGATAAEATPPAATTVTDPATVAVVARPVRSAQIPRWEGVSDIPCAAGSQALLPALEARVLHRIRPPIGLIPISVAGNQLARGLRVKVVMEIDRKGIIRRSQVAASSGLAELDRAVVAAIEEAGCMPAPPRSLVDERTGMFSVSLGYLFRPG